MEQQRLVRRLTDATDQTRLVADRLREEIIAGGFRPGDALRQDHLAERYGTSRMPVREALRVLEAEGLVVLIQNRGASVAPLDFADVQEIYEMRVAAEVLALRLAIPELTNAQLARAGNIQDQIEAAGAADFMRLNKLFHATLYAPCQRPRLLAHIAVLHDLADRYISATINDLDYADRSNQEHRTLLDACLRRDEARAVALLDGHITHAGASLRALLEEAPMRPQGVAV